MTSVLLHLLCCSQQMKLLKEGGLQTPPHCPNLPQSDPHCDQACTADMSRRSLAAECSVVFAGGPERDDTEPALAKEMRHSFSPEIAGLEQRWRLTHSDWICSIYTNRWCDSQTLFCLLIIVGAELFFYSRSPGRNL